MLIGKPVSWAGPEPAPIWLDIAREYTERWHHQEHIRDCRGQAGADLAALPLPGLATFAYALPMAFRDVAAPLGTSVQIHVTGEEGVIGRSGARQASGGSTWEHRTSRRRECRWTPGLRGGSSQKGVSSQEAQAMATLEGEASLAEQMLRTVAIIA